MKNNHGTLEDLVVQIRCTNATLLLLHSALEDGQDTRRVMESLYATYQHIDRITEDMNNQLLHVGYDVLRKAAEEAV